MPHTQEEKSCLERSELHTEWIRNRIVEGINDTQVEQLITEHWPENAFTSTTLCRGYILGAEVGDANVVFVSKDKYSESQLERNLCLQVPGMKGKKISSRDVLMVESTDSVLFDGEEGGEAKKSRLLMVVCLTPDQKLTYMLKATLLVN